MYSPTSLIASLILGTLASAIQVTSPSSSTLWSSGTSGQTVSWKAVNTDPDSFVIQLVNQAGFLPNTVTLVANQSTGSSDVTNSVTVSYLSGSWPVGTAFQVNLISSSQDNSAILAQSQQFNITSTASSSSSSSSDSSIAAVPTTLTSSSASTTSTSSSVMTITSASSNTASSNSAGDASGGIPNTAAASPSSTLLGAQLLTLTRSLPPNRAPRASTQPLRSLGSY
ncbi:MAG: hypothetical protein TREMPRED_001159 [Tremellales sp. Tagirdzhanova-0007]|nr:MAG: hypothetical protein TREMPRED_001159 [Tremellales sp. Tagirdzhanova-0007]